MSEGLSFGTGIQSGAEVQAGEVTGTNGAITWSYDAETKTVTGEGMRTWISGEGCQSGVRGYAEEFL